QQAVRLNARCGKCRPRHAIPESRGQLEADDSPADSAHNQSDARDKKHLASAVHPTLLYRPESATAASTWCEAPHWSRSDQPHCERSERPHAAEGRAARERSERTYDQRLVFW